MAIPYASALTIDNAAPFVLTMTIPGTLIVAPGVAALPIWRKMTVTNVRVRVGTQPTGASAIFDINKNGTTMFSTSGNRPTVLADTSQDLSSVPDITTLTSGDYVTVDVDQRGSIVPGADAVIVIEYT